MERDEELLLQYLEKLKEENAELKQQLAKSKRPIIDLSKIKFRVPWKSILGTMAFLGIGLIVIRGLIAFVDSAASDKITGRYYPSYNRNWQKQCYEVKEEHTFSQDPTVGKECYKTKEEAYRASERHMRLWQEGLAKEREFKAKTDKILKESGE